MLLNQLFNSYCCSFYGSQVWFLGNSCLHAMSTAYNKGLRKIWRLPFTSHTNVVLSLSGKLKLIDLTERRFCTLYLSMICSDNPHVNFIANLVKNDHTSVIGANIDLICKNNGLFDRDVKKWHSSLRANHATVDCEHVQVASVIRDLCQCQDGQNFELLGFSDTEVQSLIDCLSTMDISC